jgi:hypothetical protein
MTSPRISDTSERQVATVPVKSARANQMAINARTTTTAPNQYFHPYRFPRINNHLRRTTFDELARERP